VCTALQLGGDVEQPWLMSICDVILKFGGTQHITTPPEKDRTMAIGNMHRKFGEDGRCGSEDMIVDRQTHRHTHGPTDTLITILRSPWPSGVYHSSDAVC